MSVVNIKEAESNLSSLVNRAAAGEEIVIAKDGEPIARLTALSSAASKPRVPGDLKGKIQISADFWDRDVALEKLFEDSVLFPTSSRNSSNK